HHWAGLRPGSDDGIPTIGEHPDIQGLYINAGHFRNGLVMGPASAELLANLMTGETTIVDPAPYSPRLL
ncbi:MAG TPA: FAD-dependent oxidoreductase, partial [Halothiobacillus sp.]|nr:FAD-dependent oxidoreductase [Halothiobacillus sp.]